MPDHFTSGRRLRLTVAAMALLTAGLGLGGCAGVGDSFASGAFVDPAKYDLYDCKQLATERETLATRSDNLQELIDKAHTGTAGVVVAEVAYRNQYISTRASAKLAAQVWRRNKCDTAMPPGTADPGSAPRTGGPRGPGRSGGAVY